MRENEQPAGSVMNRETILAALAALAEEFRLEGVTGELCRFGGTVMVLAFASRQTTRDVDAIFQPARIIREAAGRVGEEMRLPAGWLNDGVKGYVSARHETLSGNLPQFPHLRLAMPVPEYLLAMKCMAARVGGTGDGGPSDVPDIIFLIRHLGLKSAKQVLNVVLQYYPAGQIPVKTQYLIEGLFEEGQV